MIGREFSPATNWSPTSEDSRWIGKPWRRVELLTTRYFYKNSPVDVDRDLTVHVGFRRLGIGFTFIASKASYIDYSEERQ